MVELPWKCSNMKAHGSLLEEGNMKKLIVAEHGDRVGNLGAGAGIQAG